MNEKSSLPPVYNKEKNIDHFCRYIRNTSSFTTTNIFPSKTQTPSMSANPNNKNRVIQNRTIYLPSNHSHFHRKKNISINSHVHLLTDNSQYPFDHRNSPKGSILRTSSTASHRFRFPLPISTTYNMFSHMRAFGAGGRFTI